MQNASLLRWSQQAPADLCLLSIYYLTPPVVPSRRKAGQFHALSGSVLYVLERKAAVLRETVYKLFIPSSRFCLNYGVGYECKHEVLKFLPFLPLLLQHTQARGPGGSPGPLAVLSYPSWRRRSTAPPQLRAVGTAHRAEPLGMVTPVPGRARSRPPPRRTRRPPGLGPPAPGPPPSTGRVFFRLSRIVWSSWRAS